MRSNERVFDWQRVLHRSSHTLLRRLPNHAPLSITIKLLDTPLHITRYCERAEGTLRPEADDSSHSPLVRASIAYPRPEPVPAVLSHRRHQRRRICLYPHQQSQLGTSLQRSLAHHC